MQELGIFVGIAWEHCSYIHTCSCIHNYNLPLYHTHIHTDTLLWLSDSMQRASHLVVWFLVSGSWSWSLLICSWGLFICWTFSLVNWCWDFSAHSIALENCFRKDLLWTCRWNLIGSLAPKPNLLEVKVCIVTRACSVKWALMGGAKRFSPEHK